MTGKVPALAGPRPVLAKRIETRRRDVRRLWDRGLTDRQIAEVLAVSHYTVNLDRKVLGLATKRPKERAGHGTAACYQAYGCRRPECREAHREEMRAYRRRKAEEKWSPRE